MLQNLRFPKLEVLLILHFVALLLASTSFTLFTAFLGHTGLKCNFFGWAYSNGWGYQYRSDYSLAEVCAYLLAYGSGVILYPLVTRPRVLARIARFICLAGFISFTVELSHWFFDHHLSLIASFPVLLFPIVVWTIVTAFWNKPRLAAA